MTAADPQYPAPSRSPVAPHGAAAGVEPSFGACREGPLARALAGLSADTRLPRGIRAALRRRIRPLAPRDPVDLEVEGIRFRARPAHNKVDFDLWAKRRLDEPEELDFLVDALAPGDVFVDLGANIGVYSLVALMSGPPGIRALAIEPHPELGARLATNAALNGVADRIAISDVAIGEAEGLAILHLGGRNAGASSLLSVDDAGATVDVRLRPLAAVLAVHEIGAVGVLKADVEGFEDRAVLPFFRTAPETVWPRAVILEHAHAAAWQKDCLSTLAELGYIAVRRTGENTMLRRTPAAA